MSFCNGWLWLIMICMSKISLCWIEILPLSYLCKLLLLLLFRWLAIFYFIKIKMKYLCGTYLNIENVLRSWARLLWEMGTSAFVWSAFVESPKKCGWLCFVVVNEMGSEKRTNQINESMWNILGSFTWLNSDFNWNYRVWWPGLVNFWLRRIFWRRKDGTWLECQTSRWHVNLELAWPCYIVCSVTSHKIWFFFFDSYG